MINFFDLFSVDTLYIVLGLAGVSLITLILAIVALCKAAKLKRNTVPLWKVQMESRLRV